MAKWTIDAVDYQTSPSGANTLRTTTIERDGVDLSDEIHSAFVTIEAGSDPVLELTLLPAELRIRLADPAVLITDDPIEPEEAP